METKYVDGWVRFTRSALKEMYNTNTAQWPEWIWVSSGNGFDAEASLLANGLDPNRIPEALRDHYIAGKLIAKIAQFIPLTYIPTPD